MSHHALFYNSQGGDRTYDADSFSDLFSTFFRDGVAPNNTGLAASPAGAMTVTIAPGAANVGGKVRVFQAATSLTFPQAESARARLDTIAVKRDDTVRDITLTVLKGKSDGTAYDMTADPGVTYLPLYQVSVPAGLTEMSAALLAAGDVRPFIAERLEGGQESLEAEFRAWFNGIREVLTEEGGDVGALAEQLNSLDAAYKRADDNLNDRVSKLENTLSGGASGGSGSGLSLGGFDMTRIWTIADLETAVGNFQAQTLLDWEKQGLDKFDALYVVCVTQVTRDANSKAVAGPVVTQLLRKGDAVVMQYNNYGTMMWREVRFLDRGWELTYKNDKVKTKTNGKVGSAAAPKVTMNAGLIFSWARYGKTIGNAYQGYNEVDWNYATAAKAIAKNNANGTLNAKVNFYLVPIAVYGVTGLED